MDAIGGILGVAVASALGCQSCVGAGTRTRLRRPQRAGNSTTLLLWV